MLVDGIRDSLHELARRFEATAEDGDARNGWSGYMLRGHEPVLHAANSGTYDDNL